MGSAITCFIDDNRANLANILSVVRRHRQNFLNNLLLLQLEILAKCGPDFIAKRTPALINNITRHTEVLLFFFLDTSLARTLHSSFVFFVG